MRSSWDVYFMSLANAVSTRSTCDRKHVGAVIVKDNRILSTGYNGSMCGDSHCGDSDHMMEGGHCSRTIHAELNAIVSAAKFGVPIDGSVMYINTFPCWNCFKAVVNAGIIEIVVGDNYRCDNRVIEASTHLGINIRILVDH